MKDDDAFPTQTPAWERRRKRRMEDEKRGRKKGKQEASSIEP